MQIAAETAKFQSLPSATLSEFSVTVWQSQFSRHRANRCNGAVVRFDPSDIPVAVTRVFLAVDGMQGAASAELQPQVIDDGLGNLFNLGWQTGSAPSWDPLIGPIG
jgi:hypothetical protein